MNTSNQTPTYRGRVNRSEPQDIYSNSRNAGNREPQGSRDIYTENRRDMSSELSAFRGGGSGGGRRPTPVQKRKKKKRRTGLKILAVFVLIFVALALAFEFWGKDWINDNFLDTQSFTDDDERLAIMESGRDAAGITNIALFGLDTRTSGEYADAGSRSDSIMILTVDKNHHKIKISSIMRDSAVYINSPKVDDDQLYKINAAYNFGGPELAVKTLNEQLELNIKEYATVDFANMEEIIDAVDGVDVEITEQERVHMNGTISEQCDLQGIKDKASYYVTETGAVHLNGMQAVAFARLRYAPTISGEVSDYGRTDRQRLVMEKLFEKAIQLDGFRLLTMGTKMVKYVETSLDVDNILSLAGILLRSDVTFEQARYPRDEDLVGDGEVRISPQEVALDVDWDSVKDSIQSFIYDDIPPTTAASSYSDDD